MTRSEREHLIERYLRGDMSLQEEENFFIEVATNSELRYELKAYRVVEQAIDNDRLAGERSYTAMRARMQQQLAVTKPVSASTATTAATTQYGFRLVAWIAGIVTLISLAVLGTLQFTNGSDNRLSAPSIPQRYDSTRTAHQPALKQPDAINHIIVPQIQLPERSAPQQVSEEPGNVRLDETERNRNHSTGSAAPARSVEYDAVRQLSVRQQRAVPPANQQARHTNEGSGPEGQPASRAQESPTTSSSDDSISIRFEILPPRSH